jgi:hypothetical protein
MKSELYGTNYDDLKELSDEIIKFFDKISKSVSTLSFEN